MTTLTSGGKKLLTRAAFTTSCTAESCRTPIASS